VSENIIIVDKSNEFSGVAAVWIARYVSHVIARQKQCRLALAGGATPRPVYSRLTEPDVRPGIDWRKVDFYFGDERCVPPEHPDSNYRMAWESLLSRVPIAEEQIRRIRGELPDRDKAAAEYEAQLPEALDLLILGMGSDGHTASLFPHAPALDERTRRVLPVNAPNPPVRRISITPPVITSARSILVLVAGGAKATMVARALQGPLNPQEIPAQLACTGTWIVDAPAAERLEKLAR
jgi:6-phosphogluconolactonase